MKFPPPNKTHFLLLMCCGLYGIQVIQLESERQGVGFIALGFIVVSAVVHIFSNAYGLKVITLCTWVIGFTFLSGYLLTTTVLE